ncbi:hypothetical protein DXT63_17115 [Thermoanaerobacteraceae bacterium SP2]|jgi:hypothetical protein|nr:hypothetical protein [Clostridiales bacterium]MDK2907284.1 hypothetical protein [Petrotoga sp.]RKL61355.1 hypothetical protein DXT63_17115 [Thermoanaerobacteraceae bacterium SP2]
MSQKTLFDKGNYGEFLTFSYLERLRKKQIYFYAAIKELFKDENLKIIQEEYLSKEAVEV